MIVIDSSSSSPCPAAPPISIFWLRPGRGRQPDEQRAVAPVHPYLYLGDVTHGELELYVAAHDDGGLAEFPEREGGVAGEDEAAGAVERVDGELEPADGALVRPRPGRLRRRLGRPAAEAERCVVVDADERVLRGWVVEPGALVAGAVPSERLERGELPVARLALERARPRHRHRLAAPHRGAPRGEQHVEVHERERGRRDPGASELHGEVPGGAERGADEEDDAGASAAHGRLRGEDPSVGGHIEEGDGVERGLVVALRRPDCR